MEILTKDNLVYRIIGASMEVHNELGSGFVEPVYQEALKIEFAERQIFAQSHPQVPVYYKKNLIKTYEPDFICYDAEQMLLVEIKAVKALLPEHKAQLLNYLKATGIEKGMLINFGNESLDYKTYKYTSK